MKKRKSFAIIINLLIVMFSFNMIACRSDNKKKVRDNTEQEVNPATVTVKDKEINLSEDDKKLLSGLVKEIFSLSVENVPNATTETLDNEQNISGLSLSDEDKIKLVCFLFNDSVLSSNQNNVSVENNKYVISTEDVNSILDEALNSKLTKEVNTEFASNVNGKYEMPEGNRGALTPTANIEKVILDSKGIATITGKVGICEESDTISNYYWNFTVKAKLNSNSRFAGYTLISFDSTMTDELRGQLVDEMISNLESSVESVYDFRTLKNIEDNLNKLKKENLTEDENTKLNEISSTVDDLNEKFNSASEKFTKKYAAECFVKTRYGDGIVEKDNKFYVDNSNFNMDIEVEDIAIDEESNKYYYFVGLYCKEVDDESAPIVREDAANVYEDGGVGSFERTYKESKNSNSLVYNN